MQSESPGNTSFEGGSVSSSVISSVSANKRKTNPKQSVSKTFQQKNSNNLGNSLGNSLNNSTAIKQSESNLNNDLIKASIPSHSVIKLLDREALDTFVKSVDPNEVLEDDVHFIFQ